MKNLLFKAIKNLDIIRNRLLAIDYRNKTTEVIRLDQNTDWICNEHASNYKSDMQGGIYWENEV